MKKFKKLDPNTTEFILAHWAWRKSRGKKHPSVNFKGIKNPRESLAYAMGERIKGKISLLGNPFIGTLYVITNPEDGAYNDGPCPRKCSLCFYRDGEKNPQKKCRIVTREGKHPNELFGYKRDEFMPMILDGKEVGNYCRNFLPFYAD